MENESYGKNEVRFHSYVRLDEESGCWNWIGGKFNSGYGMFGMKVSGKWEVIYAHRMAYQAYVGYPDDKHVLHRCDNRACVNPDHLFLGTNQDNIKDMVSKGRQSRGENSGTNKLTEKQVLEIRKSLADKNISTNDLAEKYGVKRGTIYDIGAFKSWTHLEGEPVDRRKVTEEDKKQIRELFQKGRDDQGKRYYKARLAKEFGVSRAYIHKIIQEA